MSNNLRHRGQVLHSGQQEAGRVMIDNYDEFRLSAHALLAASPIFSGAALKLHIPVIYSFLPTSVQRLLSSRCCPKSWSPQWKQRYLIAIGGYLYRFKDENGACPKGAPISVETVMARILTREDVLDCDFSVLLDCLPPGFSTVFEVSSVGKTQYMAVQSREDALSWVNSLRQSRQDTITRSMGHAENIPYPKQWSLFDQSAKRLKEQKERIKRKLEAINVREQEMQNLSLSGSISRGYYG